MTTITNNASSGLLSFDPTLNSGGATTTGDAGATTGGTSTVTAADILSRIFTQDDVVQLLKARAQANNPGAAASDLVFEDYVPEKVRQFTTMVFALGAKIADGGAAALLGGSNLRSLDALWKSMPEADKQLALDLCQKMLPGLNIQDIMDSHKNGVTSPKAFADIKEGLDKTPPENFTFQFYGKDYTISKVPNSNPPSYQCTGDGQTFNVRFAGDGRSPAVPSGYFQIEGLPKLNAGEALFLGDFNGAFEICRANTSALAGATSGLEALQKLAGQDSNGQAVATTVWPSNPAEAAKAVLTGGKVTNGVEPPATPAQIKALLDSGSGVYDIMVDGKRYQLQKNTTTGNYELYEMRADGTRGDKTSARIDFGTNSLEIRDFPTSGKGIYLTSSGSDVQMTFGPTGPLAEALKDGVTLFKQPVRTADATATMTTGSTKPSAPEGSALAGATHEQYVTTKDYVIAMDLETHGNGNYYNVTIYDKNTGKKIGDMTGDPHVDETDVGGNGWNWHFAGDSSFTLPDGTKISLTTAAWPAGSDAHVISGVDIMLGGTRVHSDRSNHGAGAGDVKLTTSLDRYSWDLAKADSTDAFTDAGRDSGEFALWVDASGNQQWAVYDSTTGHWYDVGDKAWANGAKASSTLNVGSTNVDDKIKNRSTVESQLDSKIRESRTPTTDDQTPPPTVDNLSQQMMALLEGLRDKKVPAEQVLNAYVEMHDYYQMLSRFGYSDPGNGFSEAVDGAVGGGGGGERNEYGVPSKFAQPMLDRWKTYITDISAQGANIDVNALVMWVLRESYLDTLEDLRFFADKVQFYNQLKESIRKELSNARAWMSEATFDMSGAIAPGDPTYAGVDIDTRPVINPDGSVSPAEHPISETWGAIDTRDKIDQYIKEVEQKLNSVGDDAQLANVDLQNILQKQQQTLQMLSNIAKMLHDTAQSIIRKIGG